MASHNPRPCLYPIVDQSNPDSTSPFLSNPSNPNSLYPNSMSMAGGIPVIPTNLNREETLISVPGAIVHLIDNHYSLQLASGVFSIVRLWQGPDIVAVLARIADDVQWPLMKHEPAVKVDHSHYFFSLPSPPDGSDSDDDETEPKKKGKVSDSKCDLLNYGLSFASKGQEKLLRDLDSVLETYCAFSVHKVSVKRKEEVLVGSLERETSPEELQGEGKREQMEESSAAYWTTLAPNVEDYSGKAAKLIAGGSGQLIKGILWCGDVAVDRLKWGNQVLKERMTPSEKAEISPTTMKRIRRAKRVTKTTQKVASGVLSGVVKVSGYFMTKLANSKSGKKLFNMLPGEILLASLDGFSKICDAAEVAGKNVLTTSSTVTSDLVTHRYGEEAGQATDEGLDAVGHAFGTAWAAFKIRKALDPKNAVKATAVAKSAAKAAASDYKARKASK